MDYRKMYDDKDYLYAFDLEGCPKGDDGRPERTLEIAGCSRVELTGENNKKSKKPGVMFRDEPKKLALNKTNGKTIAKLYGKETEDWAGELITIYATTTEFGGETRDCIRVRPLRPSRSDSQRGEAKRPAERQAERGSGKTRSGSSKAERDAAEVSAVTAKYLIGEYEKVVGGPGSEDRMAALKVERGRAWETLLAADREAVGAAALAAKARIDAKADGAAGSSDPGGIRDADSLAARLHGPDDDIGGPEDGGVDS